MAPRVPLSCCCLLLLLLFPLLSQATPSVPRRVGASRHSESFGSFLDLEGSKKGDKREGMHKVKQYLQRYGYMSNRAIQDLTDDFDDTLESSLKAFQTFYSLKATGILDGPTAEQMSMPRCGMPDQAPGDLHSNIAGASMINPQGQGQGHGHGRLNVSSHYVLWGGGQKWPRDQMHIHYIVDPDGHPEDLITMGFDEWTAVSNFTFERVREDSRATLKVFFQVKDKGPSPPFDGPRNVLAYAKVTLVDPTIRFDAEEMWVGGAFADSFDLQSVATHEMGHILGLAHSHDTKAVMYAYFNPDEVKPIAQDDIDGITALYRD